jgi:hypothetical protein
MQNQHLASDIFGVSKDIATSTGQITGTVQALNLSARDSTDRNVHALSNSINSTAQITQNAVERTAALTQSGIERTSGGLQSSVGVGFGSVLANQERNAGETRLTNLQTNSDSRFQWADQTRDILTLVNSTSFENRLALSTSFASILAEQAKNKEQLSFQMSENKYEDLKNQNVVVMQLAEIKNQNALLNAESKYEALKNHNMLSSQLAECCCELKTTIHSVDDARIRDELNRARIVNELRHSYGQGHNYGNQGYNLGSAVAGGFGFTIGENLANTLSPAAAAAAAARPV